jgi:hypothetical protein
VGDGSRFRAMAHLSDDETVAKMGHQICDGSDLGHPSPKVWVGFTYRPPVPPAALQIGKALSAPALPTQYSAFSPFAGTEVGTPGVPA